jgi:hypothetical protein
MRAQEEAPLVTPQAFAGIEWGSDEEYLSWFWGDLGELEYRRTNALIEDSSKFCLSVGYRASYPFDDNTTVQILLEFFLVPGFGVVRGDLSVLEPNPELRTRRLQDFADAITEHFGPPIRSCRDCQHDADLAMLWSSSGELEDGTRVILEHKTTEPLVDSNGVIDPHNGLWIFAMGADYETATRVGDQPRCDATEEQ